MSKEDAALMRSAEVRELFGIARSTLSGWKARGVVEAIEIGGLDFYRRADIKRLYEQQEQPSNQTGE